MVLFRSLVVLFLSVFFAAVAAADEEEIPVMTCDSLPVEASTGIQVKIAQKYLSLTEYSVEIYDRDGDALTLSRRLPAQSVGLGGTADELVDEYVGQDFHLTRHLKLDVETPEPESSHVDATVSGKALSFDLRCLP